MARWAVLLVLVTTSGFAADKADKEARAQFTAAQKAYDLGQFAQALTLYTAAYDAKPLPAFLFNIAQCHRQLGQYERALFFYRRFLSLAPPGTDTETVDELVAQVEKLQEDQRTSAEEAQRRQRADQEAQRQLEVERAREAAARAELESAKEQALLPRPDLLPAPPPPPPPPHVESTPLYRHWWLWAGVGVVVAGTATAVAVAAQPRSEVPTYGTLNAR